jgi:hypothetical protein
MKPLQPRERLNDALGAADVHLISLLPALEACCVPSKLYGILAAGRPILFIGDSQGEVGRVVAAGACGTTVAIGDADVLAGDIRAWSGDRDSCRRMAANARATFDRSFREDVALDAWHRTFAELAGAVPHPAPSGAPATRMVTPT